MHKGNFSETVELIIKEDPRFDREAYLFVREGLDYTLKMLQKKGTVSHRHVSGRELLEGLRRYSLDQFGPLTKTVLNYWGIIRCEDFADIVFNLVDKGVLGKTEQDSREDFKGGYDFEEAFVKPYLPAPRSRTRGTAPADQSPPADDRRSVLETDSKKLSGGPN